MNKHKYEQLFKCLDLYLFFLGIVKEFLRMVLTWNIGLFRVTKRDETGADL
jgi:hypothetical protein